MGIALNILTSGFLVTTFLFFLLYGIVVFYAYVKVGEILENASNERNNDLNSLNSALNYLKTAYILAWIAAGLSLLLAILYAGHELAFAPSEWIHMVIFLAIYVLLVISAIYAFWALNKINTVGVVFKNGADAYIWAGLLLALFAFMALTASGSGRIGMNAVRSRVSSRLNEAESKINEHLPAIREHVETHLPVVRNKVDQIHANHMMGCAISKPNSTMMQSSVGCKTTCGVMPNQMSNQIPSQYRQTTTIENPSISQMRSTTRVISSSN
jgi:hypothetical protein